MDSYDRQMQLEMELRQRKDKMLFDISDGRDEYGGGGPSLNLGKKHSSRKEEGGGGGLSGLFSGLKQGFLNNR